MKKSISFFTVIVITLGLIYPLAVNAGGFWDSCAKGPLEVQAEDLVTAEGYGVLCTTRQGLRGWVKAKGLVPGDAYTVWWVYFDDPTSTEADFGVDSPLGVFGRMDSSIAPRSGERYFSGRIGGFKPTRGSQIWMWIFGHGPADRDDGRQLARQLLSNDVDGPLGFPAAVVMFDIP